MYVNLLKWVVEFIIYNREFDYHQRLDMMNCIFSFIKNFQCINSSTFNKIENFIYFNKRQKNKFEYETKKNFQYKKNKFSKNNYNYNKNEYSNNEFEYEFDLNSKSEYFYSKNNINYNNYNNYKSKQYSNYLPEKNISVKNRLIKDFDEISIYDA